MMPILDPAAEDTQCTARTERRAAVVLAGAALSQDTAPAADALALVLAITGLDGSDPDGVRLCRCGCGVELSDYERGYQYATRNACRVRQSRERKRAS